MAGRDRNAVGVGTHSRQELEAYLPLVERIAAHALARIPRDRGVELDDLVSAGWVGLLDANRTWRADGGRSFKSHAHTRIDGAIRDWLREWDWVPRVERERSRKDGRIAAHQVAVSVLTEPKNGDDEAEHGWQAREETAKVERFDADDTIKALCKGFPRREKIIIGGYLSGACTFKQLGTALGVCESRVSQIWADIQPSLAERFTSIERIGS